MKLPISSPLPKAGAVHVHHQSPMSNPVEESCSKDWIMEYLDLKQRHFDH
jgi:hypothetical protein